MYLCTHILTFPVAELSPVARLADTLVSSLAALLTHTPAELVLRVLEHSRVFSAHLPSRHLLSLHGSLTVSMGGSSSGYS